MEPHVSWRTPPRPPARTQTRGADRSALRVEFGDGHLTEAVPFRGLAYRHTRPSHADLARTVAATARSVEPGRFHVPGVALITSSLTRHLLTLWNPAYAEDPQSLGVILHLLERDATVARVLGSVFGAADAGWLRSQAPLELRGLLDLRNPAAHSEAIGRERAEKVRSQGIGIGCEGVLVRVARVKGMAS